MRQSSVHRGEHHQKRRNKRYFMPLYRDTDSEINQLGRTIISTDWGHPYGKVMTREIHHKYSKVPFLKCVQTIQLLCQFVNGRASFSIYHLGIPIFKTFRKMWWIWKLLRKYFSSGKQTLQPALVQGSAMISSNHRSNLQITNPKKHIFRTWLQDIINFDHCMIDYLLSQLLAKTYRFYFSIQQYETLCGICKSE